MVIGRVRVFGGVVVGVLAALATTAVLATEYPGTLPGSFAVSDQGVGQYSIPISTVPGAGGLQPSLALTYSHTAGNGLAGMRWTLAGFSVISRCGKTYAQDGSVEAVNYTSTDRLCLDGQRLVDIGSSEYRTEIETFQKITTSGSAGTCSQYFDVWHGNGSYSRYGSTTDSCIEKIGSSSARMWFIAYTQDQFSNRISYSYSENTSTGEVLPTEVNWTSNAGQSLTAKYKVSIVYENRPSDDQRTGYEPGGAKTASTQRIDKIQVFFDTSTEIATYDLSYTTPTSTGTKRSQLASVTLKRGTDTLPPTTFTWQNGVAGFGSPSNTGRAYGTHPLIGDMNNDGRADIFNVVGGVWQVYQGTLGGGFDAAISTGVTPSADEYRVRVFDANGDGRSDLLYPSGSTWHVKLSTGTGFGSAVSTGLSASSLPVLNPWDFDGDGLQDLVLLSGSSILWYRNTGSSFNSAVDISHAYNGDLSANYIHPNLPPPNLNGDSRDDMFSEAAYCEWIYPYGNICYGSLYPSAATGSAYDTWYAVGDYNQFQGTTLYGLHAVDVNGDGLDEALYGLDDSNTSYQSHYLVANKGNDTASSAADTYISAYATTNMDADYNHDGRQDFLAYQEWNDVWNVYLSTGTTFATSPTTFSGTGTWPLLADVNGDGFQDIVTSSGVSGYWYVQLASTPLPDVVTTFENGLGHATSVTYQALSHTVGDHYFTSPSSGIAALTGPYVRDFNGARYVVTDVDLDDGIGGERNFSYAYAAAHVDHSGRGWLSFRWNVVFDEDQGTNTLTIFRQDWPYAGAAEIQYLRRSSDGQYIRETDPTWDKTTNTTPTPDVHFIRIESTTTKEWEVGTNYANGTHLRTVVDDPTYSTTYGLLEARTVTVTQPGTSISSTTVTDFNPGVNTTYWCLGLPGGSSTYTVSTQVTTQPGSNSATQTQYHNWNGNCTINYTIDQSESSGAKQLKTSFGYDYFGNPTSISLDSSDGSAQDRSVAIEYDNYGQFPKKETIGTVGLFTETTWNYLAGQPATFKDTDGLTTTLTYDSFGRLASEDTPGVDTNVIYFAYPNWNSMPTVYIRQTYSSDGFHTYEMFDALNRTVAEQSHLAGGAWALQFTEYNGLGQVARTSQPFVAGETAYWEEYVHDLIGRVTQITGLKDTGTTTTTFSYFGHTTQVTDPRSNTTTTVSNALGQVVSVTDAANGTASYTYKPFGELATLTDAQSNTTVLSYDSRGFKVELDDPTYGGDWLYNYDVYGQLTKQWSPIDAGSYPNYPTVELTYDQAGRLYQRFEDEGTTTHSYYAHNYAAGSNGKLYQVSAPGSYSEQYVYNTNYGTPAYVLRTIDSVNYYFNMSYDSQARLDVLSYPTVGGYTFQVDYDYDSYGHLSAVKEGGGAFAYYTLNATDALGQEREVTLGNGLKEYRTFYPRTGRLNVLLTEPSGGGTDVQHLTLTYDEVGNLKTRDDATIGIGEDFSYDSLSRLTSATVDYQSPTTASYSAAGNINSKSECGTYTYASRPHLVTGTTSCGSMSYDANSRMITRGSGEIDWFTYDQPSRIDDPTDTVYSQFWYGPDRSRIKQYQSNTGATITYVGELFEYEDTSSTDTARYYVHAGSRVVAMVERVGSTNTTQYLHRDQQNSITKITSSGGSVTQSLAYDAWGLRRNASTWAPLPSPFAGSHETERGYTGHEHLDNVGLINMNGRMQDPRLGRFISADPFIQAPYHTQSHNRLSYVMNNPATLVDPSGFFWSYDPVRGEHINPGIAGTLSPFDGEREFGNWSQIQETSFFDAAAMFDGPDNYPSFGDDIVRDRETGEVVRDWGEITKDFIEQRVELEKAQSTLFPEGGSIGDAPNYPRLLFASLARPTNTIEGGMHRAILRGDVDELRLLLRENPNVLKGDDVLIVQRAITAMESLGAQDSALLASRYGVNFWNTINHSFGQVSHNLGRVAQEFGSAAKAFAEAQRAVDAAYTATGRIPQVIQLGSSNVQVRGAVVDGIAQIRTLFIP